MTRAQLLIDRAAAGLDVSGEIDMIPPIQFDVYFEGLCGLCPDRIVLDIVRRPVNGLNVEIGQPHPRCRRRTPKHWGDSDPRAARWLASGGAETVLGLCSASICPRAERERPQAPR